MQFIGATRKFGFLIQEAQLTKNSILSSFDLLRKANYFQDKDGYFYSAFFHMTIGLERLMKLVLVTDFMLKNNLEAPGEKFLKKFSHRIDDLYKEMNTVSKSYRDKEIAFPEAESLDWELLEFLSKFGVSTRYYNLNQVGNDTGAKSPLHEWSTLCHEAYEEHVNWKVREKASMGLFHKMDKAGYRNDFTMQLSFDGHPMQQYDIFHLQMVAEKAAPILIWRVIELFQPLHLLLDKMAFDAHEDDMKMGRQNITIPHYGELFYFFFSLLPDIRRRKNWLQIFNG
jgi:hypothetical protein